MKYLAKFEIAAPSYKAVETLRARNLKLLCGFVLFLKFRVFQAIDSN